MVAEGRPVRLMLDGSALVHNWQALARASGGAATGAAVKADGYGLGAAEVARRLASVGCRDFFVAHWAEAMALAETVPPSQISVLNGLGEQDVEIAKSLGAVPVLNTPLQISRWRQAGGGRCHVMLDSGINRLGIGPEQITNDLFDGLDIDIAMSHLASADEDVPQNVEQLTRFIQMTQMLSCKRRSLANSAGIQLGHKYHFDLTRPGISLYGGVVRSELFNDIRAVVRIKAQILQIRKLTAGQAVGYNASFTTLEQTLVATIALGYADGYLRGFSGKGNAEFQGRKLPVIGRISMDLTTLDITAAPNLCEGDWVEIGYSLPDAASASGLSQYELITGLGKRYFRKWI